MYINNGENGEVVRNKLNTSVVIQFTHTKVGTVHNLTGEVNPSGVTNMSFKSVADYNVGDTFQLNGVSVQARNQKNETLTKDFFKSGCFVQLIYDGTRLHFSSGASSGGGYIIQATAPADTTILWVDNSNSFNVLLKIYIGGQWIAINGGGKSYLSQPTAPSNTNVIWIDTVNGNIAKFWNGSAWKEIYGSWGTP